MSVEAGQSLSHYRLIDKIGEGGMGVVWRALDTTLDREVAIKVLPETFSQDAERLARFEREAKALAALNHNNIVTIHAVSTVDGVPFIVMEMVAGRSLDELIPRSGLALDRLFELAIPLADAVASAHRQGITHRDLKPGNVRVGDAGTLKVLDFGLAKLKEETALEAEPITRAATRTLTGEGSIIGTVHYMSPEQAEGKPAGPTSDVFSLGVMLYEMATGRRPFEGDSAVSTITAILRDTPSSLTDLKPLLPRHLGRIVRRCLDKHPERRYQTALELRNELQALREELATGESGPAAPARSARGVWWLVAVLAVVAAASLGVVVYDRIASPPPAQDRAPLPATVVRMTTSGQATYAAISPDGKYVTHVEHAPAGWSLFVTQVGTRSTVRLVVDESLPILAPVFSPDGEFVYYLHAEEQAFFHSLYRVPTLGGAPFLVVQNVDVRATFSPDGRMLAFARGDPSTDTWSLLVAEADGEGERVLATWRFGRYPRGVAWSPDGEVIAVACTGGDWSGSGGGPLVSPDTELVVFPVEGGPQRRIASVGPASRDLRGGLAWLPDGSGLVLSMNPRGHGGHQIAEVAYPDGALRGITSDLSDYGSLSVARELPLLATVQARDAYTLEVVDLQGEGRAVTTVTSGDTRNDSYGVSWTSDGRIVFGSDTAGVPQLWIVDQDGAGLRRLTVEEALAASPSVAPDGASVVFVSDRSGEKSLWRADLGGGRPVPITPGVVADTPVHSADGRWIVFCCPVDEWQDLCRIPAAGGDAARLKITKGVFSFAVSPDGSEIAVKRWDPARADTISEVISVSSGEARPFDIQLPRDAWMEFIDWLWSPDGKAILHLRTEAGVSNVWSQPVDGGPARQVTFFEEGTIKPPFAISPDGTKLVVARGKTSRDVVLLRNFRGE